MNDPEESFEDFVEVPSTSSRNIVYSPIPHQPVTLINDRMFKKFDDCFVSLEWDNLITTLF